MNVSPPSLLVTLSGIAVLANVAVAGQLLSGQQQDSWLVAACVVALGCSAAHCGLLFPGRSKAKRVDGFMATVSECENAFQKPERGGIVIL